MHGLGLIWFSGSIVIARRYWYIGAIARQKLMQNTVKTEDRSQQGEPFIDHIYKSQNRLLHATT